ncbi:MULTISPECIES: cytochrome P450 [unclassified Streptomyces]|uniref:cytochrome P450 n=1 Tax=unclassified Streptomyces TaxID=2593676 RepID=UPI0008DC5F8A|nr:MULTISPECIES: cytochrome P450 [unclassified Streptomyces]OII70665.1 hypothetical protein BJP39_12555 [Streptomyces sp. CC77]
MASMPLERVDLFDQGYVRDPFPVAAALREHAPVMYDDRTGLWLVSRYDDVRAILLDTENFLPDNALDAVSPFSVRTLRTLAKVRFSLPRTLANNGGDSHAGYRRILTRLLNAHAVNRAAPLVERITAECLDDVEARLDADGVCDLATTLARDVPFRVMLGVLGLEEAVAADGDVDIETLTRWSATSLELFWGRLDEDREEELARDAADFYAWLTRLVQRGPDDDPGTLLGALAAHRLPDGRPPSAAQRAAVLYFIVIAGQMTTSQMLSTMFRRALEQDGQWRRFAREPETAAPWAEEMLRREPPITTWRRVTARPVTVAGTELPAGAQVLLMLAAAGSDPAVFDDPEQICPYRGNVRRHLAFGLGAHRCSGAELARLEAGTVLRMAAARLPGLRSADTSPPPMLSLLSFRAPLRVLVARG